MDMITFYFLVVTLFQSDLLLTNCICQFPSHWSGIWFQKGVHDRIRITSNSISDKGNCTENDKAKFLIYNKSENCARCMVIYEKHHNVLQYKETLCSTVPRKLNDLCDEINGDAPLFSLFRLDTPPVPCPFSGYFKFSYNRGRGECGDPPSTIDSCTDENHLLFRFQACTDVQGSESKVVTLECYATWKGGSVKYLVGKFLHPSAKDEDDRFHCFVFEQRPDNTYHLAQSADASCDGLEQTLEGSATMKLARTERLENQCSFPDLAITGRYWQTLDGSHVYDFGHENSFSVYSKQEGTLLRFVNCTQHDPTSDAFVVYSTAKCDIGYVCMKIVKRSDNIIEILQGDLVKSIGDACLNFNKYEYITLTGLRPTEGDESFTQCPLDGIYNVNVQGNEASLRSATGFPLITICFGRSILFSQCIVPNRMRFELSCGSTEPTFKYFQCNGLWHENGTNYLLLYSADDDIQYCLNYKETESRIIKATFSNTNCRPSRKAQQLSNSYSINDYDYHKSGPSNNHELSRNHHHSESIHFDLSSKGLCYATAHGSSNFHINQLMLSLPIGVLLIRFTQIL
ncbi:uncharacterized protein LOC128389464 [Panonychus citri]|uniref:uncharacterized protein LOC128389464 n=1 Tax=Panonychus citri TaxID=50023 RepID=UPI0023079148|nr:uncharacterized protein LOC128389464 [Panonychus citri]